MYVLHNKQVILESRKREKVLENFHKINNVENSYSIENIGELEQLYLHGHQVL
jgi:hypothetical protein